MPESNSEILLELENIIVEQPALKNFFKAMQDSSPANLIQHKATGFPSAIRKTRHYTIAQNTLKTVSEHLPNSHNLDDFETMMIQKRKEGRALWMLMGYCM